MTLKTKPKDKPLELDVKQIKKAVETHVEDVAKPGEIVPVENPIVPQNYKSKLTKQQVDLIKNTIAKGASDDELKMFLYVCERTRLDPFTKQIHLVPRWDSRMGKEIRTPIVGIDGLRSIAERTGEYAGNDDPTFDDETKPTKATVSVYKIVQGVRSAFTASARWEQYFPGDKQGFMWKKMPHLMLGKCAEALALRKAFPAVMSGLYVVEEVQQAQNVPIGPNKPNQATSESDYDKATRLIGQMNDEKGLHELHGKLKTSEKYSEDEKQKLLLLVEDRIFKITAPTNASRNVPPAQHAENAGAESK